VSRAVRGGKNAAPTAPKQKGSFSLAMVDRYITERFPLSLDITTEQSERVIRDVAITVLHRLTYGRIGELRSFNTNSVRLLDARRHQLPTTPENWWKCSYLSLVFYGTKTGSGPRQESAPITIAMPRKEVIGSELFELLHPGRFINELQRRYHGRAKFTKASQKAQAESVLFGEGFFLDTTPNKDGAHAPLAAASFSSAIANVLKLSGVTAIDGASARAYLQRGTSESLLVDTGFPITAVCKQARHKQAVLAKSYYESSDARHVLTVFQLKLNTDQRHLPVRQSEALLCATKASHITSAARTAHQNHVDNFQLTKSR
jgi:hypothetical protein